MIKKLEKEGESERPAAINIARHLDPNSGSHRCHPQERRPPRRSSTGRSPPYYMEYVRLCRGIYLQQEAVVMATRLLVPGRRRRPLAGSLPVAASRPEGWRRLSAKRIILAV